jgi:hypothetical protein
MGNLNSTKVHIVLFNDIRQKSGGTRYFCEGGALFPPSLLLAKVIFGDTGIKQVLACLTLTQKEVYFAKVPCITLDTVSAWPETVEDGWNMVVGKENDRQQIQRENIIDAVRSFEPNKNNLIYLVTGRPRK